MSGAGMDWSNHVFIADWDAPVEQVRVWFAFLPGSPATRPDMRGPGSPAEPDQVEVQRVQVRHGGEWHDVPWRAGWAAEQFRDDLVELAQGERIEGRARRRRAA